MAMHVATRAPKQLGCLRTRPWPRPCGGVSAVYTAAVQPQVSSAVHVIKLGLCLGSVYQM